MITEKNVSEMIEIVRAGAGLTLDAGRRPAFTKGPGHQRLAFLFVSKFTAQLGSFYR